MNNLIVLSGTLHKVFDATITPRGFEKRIFWLVEDTTRNSSTWQLEAHQAMSNELDNFKPGEKINVHVEVKGREWSQNGKGYVTNTLRAYKITRLYDDETERAVNAANARVNQIVK